MPPHFASRKPTVILLSLMFAFFMTANAVANTDLSDCSKLVGTAAEQSPLLAELLELPAESQVVAEGWKRVFQEMEYAGLRSKFHTSKMMKPQISKLNERNWMPIARYGHAAINVIANAAQAGGTSAITLHERAYMIRADDVANKESPDFKEFQKLYSSEIVPNLQLDERLSRRARELEFEITETKLSIENPPFAFDISLAEKAAALAAQKQKLVDLERELSKFKNAIANNKTLLENAKKNPLLTKFGNKTIYVYSTDNLVVDYGRAGGQSFQIYNQFYEYILAQATLMDKINVGMGNPSAVREDYGALFVTVSNIDPALFLDFQRNLIRHIAFEGKWP